MLVTAPSAADASEAAEDARRFGFPDDVVARIEGRGGDAEAQWFEVWPENWDSVIAFSAIASQWRAAPLARGGLHYIGLDYAAARAGLELAGIAVTPECWGGIRVMEAEARSVLNRG